MDPQMDDADRLSPRWWLWPLALGVVAVAVLLPLDGVVREMVRIHPPEGDLRRELEALQQYGALGSMIIGCAIIASVDPKRRGRLADWLLAAGLAALACLVAKVLFGRVRPGGGAIDPYSFLGPFGSHPIPGTDGRTYAWELGAPRVSQLWSMPSSHTAAAMAMSVFLARVYPRLKAFAVVMVLLVAAARVLADAHYLSDVVAGALLGYLVARPIIGRQSGVRLLGRLRPRRNDE